MFYKSALGFAAVPLALVLGCGATDPTISPSPSGSGGANGLGGAATGGQTASTTSVGGAATGGTSSTGGATSSTGGATTKATGGATAKATGGAAAGGAATGGATTNPDQGGSVGKGGSATGGGGPKGGAAAGGTVASGGRATGGAAVQATGGQGTAGNTGSSADPVKSPGCGTATTAKSGNAQTITVGTSSRSYNLKLPDSYDMNKAYRLIVAIHWLNGTAQNVTDGNYYGLWSLSQNSTVFVAPQGINNGWSNSGGSDTTFIKALVTQLEGQLCIDTSRVFAEGFSMGGSMSYALASAAPEVFRGVAVHSGGPMSGTTAGHSKPVAYFMTHGNQDTVCTYPAYGVPQLQDFAKVNGCKTPDPSLSASAFAATLPVPTSSAGSCIDFTGCTAGYPVRSCIFVGPHTATPSPNWIPAETWKFLSQF